MAAPEYLVKLKFGTEIDQKKFQELQQAYEKLTDKQKRAFAKAHNTEISQMNKLFQKETQSNLQKYEQAAIKTEKTISAARIKELRDFINKRNQQMKRLPGYAGGAIAAAGLLAANAAISSSTNLTGYEKNTASKTMNGAASGIAAGAMVAGIPGAVVGGIIGAAGGLFVSEFENTAEALQHAGQLFNTAVTTYRSTLDSTKGMRTGMYGAGFSDLGEYTVYKQALKNVGIENDSFMNDLARSLASYKETETLGKQLINMRRDAGLEMLYQRYLQSGMSAREFVMAKTDRGGLNQSDFRADALITLFERGGLQKAIYDVMAYTDVAKGRTASDLNPRLQATEQKRQDLENREWALKLEQMNRITEENINMNSDIIKYQAKEFERSVNLMKESNIILAGVNAMYKIHEKELAQTFARITRETGVGTVYSESASKKLDKAIRSGSQEDMQEFFDYVATGGRKASSVKPLMSRVDDANMSIINTRAENKGSNINNGRF